MSSNTPKPKLPPSCYAVYKDYKSMTAHLIRWMLGRAQELQVNPFKEENPYQSSQSRTQTKPKKGGRGKKRSTAKGQTEEPEDAPLPTDLTVSQLLKLAVSVATETIAKVPKDVLDLLDLVVQLREENSLFYQNLANSGIPGIKKGNVGHAHFIQVLREIRRILADCPIKVDSEDAAVASAVEQQLISRFANMAVMSLAGLGDASEDVDASAPPDKDEWLPDHLKRTAPKRIQDKPSIADRPLGEFNLLADDDEDGSDDVRIASWCLFRDLDTLRTYIRTIWEEYRSGTTSLIAASFATTQAVQVVKDMEADFAASFGSHFADCDYVEIVKAMMEIPLDWRVDEVANLLELVISRKTHTFLMVTTWFCLWKFGGVIQPGVSSIIKPGYFGYFDPSADREKMSWKECRAEDFCLLMNHLPDVHLEAILSGSGSMGRRKQRSTAETVDEPALVRDLRPFIEDSRRVIKLHLVFQWEVWKDIVLINRSDLQKSLTELHRTTKSLIASANNWIDELDQRFYNEQTIKLAMKHVVDRIEKFVLYDPPAEHKRNATINAPYADQVIPFRHFLYNPWACGMSLCRVLLIMHDNSVAMINSTGYFSSTLQLYYALRQHNKIDQWPLMDKLFDICSPTIFRGPPPRIGSFTLGHLVSVGTDPAILRGRRDPKFVQTGEGTGTFPSDMGGSLLAKISEELKFELTDEVVAELFPRSDDETAVVLARGKRPAQQTPSTRFGGKRCDPFSLLAAIKDRVEKDLTTTALAIDLFNVQRMAISIFDKWHSHTHTIFKTYFGARYQEKDSQLPFLVSYLFVALEKPHTVKNWSAESTDKLVVEAVRAVQEVKEDMERRLAQGAKLTYL